MKEANEITSVENMIYELDGMEVMLDSDLAKLYHVETKRINEAVKNNPNKFPERFSKILSEIEWKSLRSKFSTLENNNIGRGHYSKYLPRVFTEQGIYMLATILKSNVAIEVSIKIMDTFVKMRHYINYNSRILPHKVLLLENKVDENTKKIDELFNKFNPNDITDNCIFFNGDYYDAYSKILDILRDAKKEIIIIDNYADKELLDIIRNIKIKVIIITKPNNLLKDKDIEKYNKQYHNLTVKYDNTFHDRYFILDKKILYYCGASINRIGYKTFSIIKVSDFDMLNLLLKKINGGLKNE